MGYNAATNTYDTFTDLRLAIGQSSSSVKVLGSTSVNDQQGGTFYWDDASTAPDDNINVIQPLSVLTGRWMRFKGNLQQITTGGANNVTTNAIWLTGGTDYQNISGTKMFYNDATETTQIRNFDSSLEFTSTVELGPSTAKMTLGANGITLEGTKTTNEKDTYAPRFVATDTQNPDGGAAGFRVQRTLTATPFINQRGFRDDTIFNRPGASYCTFDSAITVVGAGASSHVITGQSRPIIQGDVGSVEGFWTFLTVQNGAVIDLYAPYVAAAGTIQSGEVKNMCAYLIEDNMPGTESKKGFWNLDANCPSYSAGDYQFGKNIIVDNLPSYVDDAAADADTNLPSKALYKLNAGRAIYQKP